MPAYRAVDNHVDDRARAFLRKRHKVQGRGTRRFSDDQVFGALGVLRLRRMHLGPPPCALGSSQSESRMREIRTSGLTSGDGKRGVAAWPKPPRPSSTLPGVWRAWRKLLSRLRIWVLKPICAMSARPVSGRTVVAQFDGGLLSSNGGV